MTARPKPLSAKASKFINAERLRARARNAAAMPMFSSDLTLDELDARIRREVSAQMARRIFIMRAK